MIQVISILYSWHHIDDKKIIKTETGLFWILHVANKQKNMRNIQWNKSSFIDNQSVKESKERKILCPEPV